MSRFIDSIQRGAASGALDQGLSTTDTPTFAGIVIAAGGTIGQAAGPLLTFNDTDNILEITGCTIGVGGTPVETLDIFGTIKFRVSEIDVNTPSSGALNYTAGTGFRFISWGADASTKGGFSFEGYTSTGSANMKYITILSNGNIGLYQINPVEVLDVAGAIKVRSGGFQVDTASSFGIAYQNETARLMSWGPDGATQGTFSFEGWASDGSPNAIYLSINATGVLTIPSLAGVGTRNVVVDANGVLSAP